VDGEVCAFVIRAIVAGLRGARLEQEAGSARQRKASTKVLLKKRRVFLKAPPHTWCRRVGWSGGTRRICTMLGGGKL